MTTQNKTPELFLYTAGFANGQKISITLEELGLPYDFKAIDLDKKEQKEDWFVKMNPNGQAPILVDKSNNNFAVFESGAIMQYLVDTYDKDHKLSYPHGTNEYWQTTSWLFFQNAGVGPMQGQLNHFSKYAPEKIDYAVTRYYNETRRLYSVLENRLKDNGDWLVGDKFTIADIANYAFVNMAFSSGVEISEFPVLDEWCERISARVAVKKGLDVPTKFELKKRFLESKGKNQE